MSVEHRACEHSLTEEYDTRFAAHVVAEQSTPDLVAPYGDSPTEVQKTTGND